LGVFCVRWRGWEERAWTKGSGGNIHGKGCDFDGQAVEILICEVVGIWCMRGQKGAFVTCVFDWNYGRKTTKGRKEAETA